jgi:hypothetical protein
MFVNGYAPATRYRMFFRFKNGVTLWLRLWRVNWTFHVWIA